MTAIGEQTVRIPTQIPGLDPILEGGFLQGGVYIVEGPPGVGKTTLGSHFCFNYAKTGGKAVYVTLLAESHTRLLGHLRRMTFFDPSLVADRVMFLSAFKVLEAEGLASVLKLVRHTISAQKAQLLVLDGLVSAEEASTTPTHFKKFIHELQVVASMTSCTVLLLNSTERPRGFRPERTMVDGILELEDELVRLRAIRRISVRKMRGASQVRGRHYMAISDDGIRVMPRIETVGLHARVDQAFNHGPERMRFAVAGLDEMMHGGLPSGSITCLVGPSGSGKTILGMQFLAAGIAQGQSGIYFGFFERPGSILAKSERLGLGFAEAEARGDLQIHWNRPVEGVIDELADRLIGAAKRGPAKRLFIDGLQGLHAAAETNDRLREVLTCITDELELLGVTTLYSSETPDLFGENLQLSMLGMSALTHNIVLLNHSERVHRTRRTITVLKLRDSAHDLSVREFAITNEGIQVAEAAPGAIATEADALQAPPTKKTPARLENAQKPRKRRT